MYLYHSFYKYKTINIFYYTGCTLDSFLYGNTFYGGLYPAMDIYNDDDKTYLVFRHQRSHFAHSQDACGHTQKHQCSRQSQVLIARCCQCDAEAHEILQYEHCNGYIEQLIDSLGCVSISFLKQVRYDFILLIQHNTCLLLIIGITTRHQNLVKKVSSSSSAARRPLQDVAIHTIQYSE